MASRTLAGAAALKGDWALGEDLWKDEHDANLLTLSVFVGRNVMNILGTTPGSPAEGDRYIFNAAHPTQANKIAVYDEATWKYWTPLEGQVLYNIADGKDYQFKTVGGWAEYQTSTPAAALNESIDDRVAALLVQSGLLTATYDDAGNALTLGVSTEAVQDAIAAMLTQGTNITLTYDDVANTLTIAGVGASTPPRPISFFFTSTPTASEVLLLYVATETLTLADDFAGSQCSTGTNPTSSFVLTVKKNGSSVGTITISTGGSATFATTGTTVPLAAGDVLSVEAPATPDATIKDVAVSFKGAI